MPEMTEIEKYAVDLVGTGALSHAEDDIDEEGEFADEDDWRAARTLALSMAQAIQANPTSFYCWYITTGANDA
jgi:hypothetical protein